jgi:hypothetical protein
MKSHLLKLTARAGLLCLMVVFALSCEQGEVIEKIGNESITTAEYEDNYNTSVELATRYANAEKSTLYKLVCNPSIAPNAQARDMALQLAPSVNYQQFRDARIVEIVAEEEGFLDRPIVQKILEQTRRNTLAQLYVTEKLWERIKISEEDKQETCQELRKEDPARVGPLPLDDCLRIAEGILKTQQSRREAQKVFDEIKEKVKITKNEKFDREEYLKNGLELFKTIKTEGGCAEEGAAVDNPDAKAKAQVPGF